MDTALEIAGFLLGILYLWWEYNADRRVWLASMIMPAISMWLYFSKGIYADFAINIYYLVIAVYGYMAWKHGGTNRKEKKPLKISHVPAGVCAGAVGATVLLWLLLAWILKSFTDSTVPYADGFTTALSIVGMWMMARKYAEQWIAWFIVDAVSTFLYAYKGLILYPILYAAYTVISIFGYRKWLMLMKNEDNK